MNVENKHNICYNKKDLYYNKWNGQTLVTPNNVRRNTMKVVLYVFISVLTVCYFIALALGIRKQNKPTRAKAIAPVVISLALSIIWFIMIFLSDNFIIPAIFMHFFTISFFFNYIELKDDDFMQKKVTKDTVVKDLQNKKTTIGNDQTIGTKS